MTTWSVYILRCSDDTYYVGYSNDVEKRLETHNAGKGAKYTRSRLPCRVVFTEQHGSKSAAMKRECQIKTWTRAKKQALINGETPESIK
ncbi:MAG: hypothetical protein C0615_10900 [Desulfuromonas sp.]|nr:MAG: hypothetical protein C0615_10900 [Desulfuromonas sp.]